MHLSQILPEVKTLTKSAGDFIRQESRQFESSKIEVKSKNSLVSYVDKQAEEKLVKGLKHIAYQHLVVQGKYPSMVLLHTKVRWGIYL